MSDETTIEEMWVSVMAGQIERGSASRVSDAYAAIMARPEEDRPWQFLSEIDQDPMLALEFAIMVCGAFHAMCAIAQENRSDDETSETPEEPAPEAQGEEAETQ